MTIHRTERQIDVTNNPKQKREQAKPKRIRVAQSEQTLLRLVKWQLDMKPDANDSTPHSRDDR